MRELCVLLFLFVQTISGISVTGTLLQEKDLLKSFLPTAPYIDNQICRKQSASVLSGIANLEIWALKFVDAASKLQPGFLSGHIKDFGNFDQCVENVVEDDYDKSMRFQGKYCLAHIHVESMAPNVQEKDNILDFITYKRRHIEITKNRTNLNVRFPDVLPSMALFQRAVCVPSSCGPIDVENMLNHTLDRVGNYLGLRAYAEVFEENCYTIKSEPWSTGEMIFAVCIGAIVFVAICGTCCDMSSKSDTNTASFGGTFSRFRSFLLHFSLSKNWSSLVSTMAVQRQRNIASLDGLRFINTCLVVLCHITTSSLQLPYINTKYLYDAAFDIKVTPMYNLVLGVDAFLVIGGTVRAFNMIKQLEKKNYNCYKDYVKRYLRLTPAYAAVIFFYATVFSRTGSGPTWNKNVRQSEQVCQQFWPLNLLYINNLVHDDKMCMIQSWYLAADMQMYILAPLIIYPLWKWPAFGKKVFSAAFVISMIIPFTITFAMRGAPLVSLSSTDEDISNYFRYIHFFTPSRFAPYLVGIALGLILNKIENWDMKKFPKALLFVGWFLSALVVLVAFFGSYYFVKPFYQYNVMEASLYGGLHRAVYGIAIAWIIFACHIEGGGAVATFLSAKAFQPLSKLSYCIFLTHYVVISYMNGILRTNKHLSVIGCFHDLFGYMTFIIILSTIVHLLIEAPISSLSGKLFSKKSVTPKK